MGLFHTIMNKLGRYRLIPDRRTGTDYMHRYYLFLKDRKKFPFNVTLHKIVRSDDPIMHDHPWSFTTLILAGGYWEHTPKWNEDETTFEDVRVWRGPGSIIHRSATELHWLELDNEKPATTLFFMGPQEREWGFIINSLSYPRWIQYQEYLVDWQEYHEKYVIVKREAA
jgi:hypothetical protein